MNAGKLNTETGSLEAEKNEQELIYSQALTDTVDFYNKHEQTFKAFEEKVGFDVWFLQHFRVYFDYREILLNQHKAKQQAASLDTTKKSSGSSIAGKLGGGLKIIQEFLYMLLAFRPVSNPKSGVVMLADSYTNNQDVYGALEDEFQVLPNREVFNPKKELPAYRKFRNSAPGSDQLLVSYLFGGTVIKDFRMFRAAYNELKKQLLSVNHSEKSEAAIANLLVQNQPSLYIYYARFRAFSKYFKQAEVKGVLMRDENSPQQKVIQYAARLNEVKTFGYQHGNIYQFNPAYIYGQYKTKPQLPDLTFVWGQSSFEMLLSKGGFAESEVCVTGRIDVTRQEARKNPKLDQDKKIILYATQPQHDTEMRVRHLEDVLLAAKELEQDYCLVIRPHPAEKDDAFFTQIAEKVGATNYFIDRFSDLNTHMQVCACLITGFSTVGTEFVPFFKPLLVMDYLNQDLMGWINQGVGEQILSRQDLVNALRTKTEVNKERHQKFIEKHFFKMDGKAAQRISQAILERTNAPI